MKNSLPSWREPTFTKKLKFTKVPIEAAMKLPNGREVRDLPTLKAALMADKERILKGIIGKLISYAHGRDVTRADRPHIDAVFASIAKEDYSLRAAIHAIVAHPAFGRKKKMRASNRERYREAVGRLSNGGCADRSEAM